MKRRTLLGVVCLLAVTLMGVARVSAAEKFNVDPNQVIPKPDGKEADMSKPVQVFILMGQSNMCGMGNVSKLEEVVKGGKYPYLVDDAGKWSERKDVRNINTVNGSLNIPKRPVTNGPLTIQAPFVGVDQPIGHILGNMFDAPVLLIKCANGNRSLGFDLLPPGSEPYEFEGKMEPGYCGTPADPKLDGKAAGRKGKGSYGGWEYDINVQTAKKILADIGKYYPGATKYEVAGFFYWQGENDGNPAWAQRYELNMANFIKAVRKDFAAPNAKFVLATMGEATKGSGGSGGKILDAQLAVDGNSGKHPEFKGNVATVYSNPMSKGGKGQGHYGGNPEVYMDIGEAMGRAMAELLKKETH
jgi:hypothetical protein